MVKRIRKAADSAELVFCVDYDQEELIAKNGSKKIKQKEIKTARRLDAEQNPIGKSDLFCVFVLENES